MKNGVFLFAQDGNPRSSSSSLHSNNTKKISTKQVGPTQKMKNFFTFSFVYNIYL